MFIYSQEKPFNYRKRAVNANCFSRREFVKSAFVLASRDTPIAWFNEQIFFRVGDQRLQDVRENVISAPKTEFMINVDPITEMSG